MKLTKIGRFWLRTATMAHPGFEPGAPWNANPDFFQALEDAGMVESHYSVDEGTGREYRYAVATSLGHSIIRSHGARVSVSYLGAEAEKWSERLDSNQRPLTPQESADG